MSRTTGIKSPAVLARESRRSGREDLVAHWSNLFATNQHMHPEQCTDHHIQGEHCKAKGSGEKLAEGAHGSVLVLGVKAEPNDDDECGDGKASKNVECGHGSALHLGGLALGFGQLGPDQVPVIRAEVLATNLAGRGALDQHALSRFWRGPPVEPHAHATLTSANCLSKGGLASKMFNCSFECVHASI